MKESLWGTHDMRGMDIAMASFLAAVLFLTPVQSYPAGEKPLTSIVSIEIDKDTVWSGGYRIEGDVIVSEGARLTIRAGSRIYFRERAGKLTILGSMAVEGGGSDPVIFRPEPGKGRTDHGIVIQGSKKESVFIFSKFAGIGVPLYASGALLRVENSFFEDCQTGIELTRGSRASVAGTSFIRNGVGLASSQNSSLEIVGSTFEGNGRGVVLSTGIVGRLVGNIFRGGEGLTIRQAAMVSVEDNVFEECRIGLIANEVKEGITVVGNRFKRGEVGVQCLNFANMQVACCEFRDLEVGMLIQRFSIPVVRNNLFLSNRISVAVGLKSNGLIVNNVFRQSDKAVFIDMSSYPKINRNDFLDNGKDIALGKYMSADWENRIGSGAITKDRAARSHTGKMDAMPEGRKYEGVVDATENWWGEKVAREMREKGPDSDITTIDDYHDCNEVSYPGYGEGTYRKDRVVYDPWAVKAIENVGPLQGGCDHLIKSGKTKQ